MDQLAFQFAPLPRDVEWKTISRVGPIVPAGLSRARHVWADDGSEYIAKSIGLGSRQTRFAPANELIAALLGADLGVPVNDFVLLSHGESILFGSAWLPEGSRGYCTTSQTLAACTNSDDVFKIVPFDVLIGNTDRHACNLLIRYQRAVRRPDTGLLIANDHDRCLLPGNLSPEELTSYWSVVPPARFVRAAVLREAFRNPRRLDETVKAIETLSDAAIARAVRTVPDGWMSRTQKRSVRSFLLDRRGQVRAIVEELAEGLSSSEGTLQ